MSFSLFRQFLDNAENKVKETEKNIQKTLFNTGQALSKFPTLFKSAVQNRTNDVRSFVRDDAPKIPNLLNQAIAQPIQRKATLLENTIDNKVPEIQNVQLPETFRNILKASTIQAPALKTLQDLRKKDSTPQVFNVGENLTQQQQFGAQDAIQRLLKTEAPTKPFRGLSPTQQIQESASFVSPVSLLGIGSQQGVTGQSAQQAELNLLSQNKQPSEELSKEAANFGFAAAATANMSGPIKDVGKKLSKEAQEQLPKELLNVLENTKQRGIAKKVQSTEFSSPNPNIDIETAQNVSQALSDIKYKPITNKQTISKAKQEIRTKDIDTILREINEGPFNAEASVKAQQLIKNFQDNGQYEQALDLVEKLAEKATNAGQVVQSFSLYNKLQPEGILQYADRQIRRAGGNLNNDIAEDLVSHSKQIAKMPEGREKIVETALMLKKIQDQIPVGMGQKISTIQTLFQLLNPKTAVRNIIGNVGFSGIENVKDVVATPLDMLISVATGKRTKAFPSIGTQLRSAASGFKEGFQDARLGIDTTPQVKTQFDLPRTPVFKGRVGKAAQKLLDIELKTTDRALYQAARDESLRQQMSANKLDKPTDEMLEAAHLDGLYRTFQDQNSLSKGFQKIKDSLNTLTGNKDFGLGDLVLKYPKTPANLLKRGIEYSPAGFLDTVYQLARPALGKTFNQKQFIESTSRALTGTSTLIGSGALLHRLGIITGSEREEDTKVKQLKRETGLGEYRLNISALKRYALSGFDAESAKLKEGDTIVSYDWFQPAAIGLSIGASIDENMQKNPNEKGAVLTLTDKLKNYTEVGLESMQAGSSALSEQPIVSNLTRLAGYGDLEEGLANVAKGAPASFIPTILNQIKQFIDNDSRQISGTSDVNEAINLVKNKIPKLSDDLPERKTLFGETQKTGQTRDEMNPIIKALDIFVNPAFVSKYKPTKEAQYVLDLYEKTGDTGILPTQIGRTETINGEEKKLSGKQISAMQTYVGRVTATSISQLSQNPEFQKKSDEEKASEISSIIRDAHSAGKILILGNQPERPTQQTLDILQQTTQRLDYFSPIQWGMIQNQ